ncbi:MAG: hypothetical protein GF308_06080 [Candidatus Heimdallarchaeota archaeon]|nr:hypothetical protein [Candidatus Heimdallarchaeota archaeon]
MCTLLIEVSNLKARSYFLLVISLILTLSTASLIAHIPLESLNYSFTQTKEDLQNVPLNLKAVSLAFSKIAEISDDNLKNSQGDDDGEVDAGETIELRILLENTGDESATNVLGTIDTLDSKVTILTASQDFVTIAGNSTGISSSYYVFQVDSSCDINHMLNFSLMITAEEGTWTDDFSLRIMGKPEPVYDGYEVVSESDGDLIANDNHVVDPGEEIYFRINIANIGGAKLYNLEGVISAIDSYLTIESDLAIFGNIEGNGGRENAYYKIIVSGACPDKYQFNISLELTDSYSNSWSSFFTIIVNGTQDYILEAVNLLEYEGDMDGEIDVGEIWYPEVTIRNTGNGAGDDVEVNISTLDPFISFTYSYSQTVDFGTIAAGQNKTKSSYSYWSFEILYSAPKNHVVVFFLSVSDANNPMVTWTFSFNITIVGRAEYELVIAKFFEIEGNGDNDFDSGESWNVNITLANIGKANGYDVYALLSSKDKYITFNYEDLYYREEYCGNINVGENISVEFYTWDFTIADYAEANHNINFTISVWDASGDIMWNFTRSKTVIGTPMYQILSIEFLQWYGDSDGKMEASENWYPNITIQNIGKGIGRDIRASISSAHTKIIFDFGEIENREEYFSMDFQAGDIHSLASSYYWSFSISDNVWTQKEVDFTIIIKDSIGEIEATFTITQTISGGGLFNHPFLLVLIIGGIIAIIVGGNYLRKNNQKVKDYIEKTKKRLKNYRKEWRRKRELRKEEKMRLRLQKQKEREARRQQKERERISRINKNERILLEKFEKILLMSQTVNIIDVAKSLGLSKEQLFEKMIQWQKSLAFKIDDEEIVVIDKLDFAASVQAQYERIERRLYTCHFCGFPIEGDTRNCPDCGKTVLRCVVCKLPIAFGDSIGQCPICEVKGHLVDMQEWVKVKGKCPKCFRKIPLEEIIPIKDSMKK